jgi:hypothetical protein
MSKRDLYHQMIKLIEQENEVIKNVRNAEDEVNGHNCVLITK